MLGADNRIDGTRTAAVHAANTYRLIDNGDRRHCLFDQRDNLLAEQMRDALNGGLATRWTKVDRGGAVDDGCRIGATPGVPTLSALRLWQKVIHLLDKIARV
jgi:hypothetical protein